MDIRYFSFLERLKQERENDKEDMRVRGEMVSQRAFVDEGSQVGSIPTIGQTRTLGVQVPPDAFEIDCGKQIGNRSLRCKGCSARNRPKVLDRGVKIPWPTIDELLLMVNEQPFTTVAQKLGVSDNAIRKRLRSHLGQCPSKRKETNGGVV